MRRAHKKNRPRLSSPAVKPARASTCSANLSTPLEIASRPRRSAVARSCHAATHAAGRGDQQDPVALPCCAAGQRRGARRQEGHRDAPKGGLRKTCGVGYGRAARPCSRACRGCHRSRAAHATLPAGLLSIPRGADRAGAVAAILSPQQPGGDRSRAVSARAVRFLPAVASARACGSPSSAASARRRGA